MTKPASQSAKRSLASDDDNRQSVSSEPRFPVETDIVIRPDGTIVVMDLPQELSSLQDALAPPTKSNSEDLETN